jgi:acyl carrier protein
MASQADFSSPKSPGFPPPEPIPGLELTRLNRTARPERREALEALVTAQFRHALLMDGEEELPQDRSFFDLGLTSLRLTEVKQRLEAALCCEISANELFNQPTIEALLDYLVGGPLAALFSAPAGGAGTATASGGAGAGADDSAEREMAGSVLAELYGS